MSTDRKPNDKPPVDMVVDFDGTRMQWDSIRSESEMRTAAMREEAERRKRSKGEPSNVALPRTLAWAAELPLAVRPRELMRLYARVANQIAADWEEPDAMRAYFAQLVVSHRANRKGFPGPVECELFALHNYYLTLHPETLELDRNWQDLRKR